MRSETNESWNDYINDYIRCPDPAGYLTATGDLIEDLENILRDPESNDALVLKLNEFINERKKFVEYGWESLPTHAQREKGFKPQ